MVCFNFSFIMFCSVCHITLSVGLITFHFSAGSGDSEEDLLPDGPPPLVSRPTSVAAAMRVLEVQEQLEGVMVPHPSSGPPPSQGPPPPTQQPAPSPHDAALADGEKALLRQMCNVSCVHACSCVNHHGLDPVFEHVITSCHSH